MAKQTERRYEDRGQSGRPPDSRVGARNQGGTYASPSPRERNSLKPPPVARSRKDSIQRPVNENRSSVGGIEQRNGQGAGGRLGPPDSPNQDVQNAQRAGLLGPPGEDIGKASARGGSQRAMDARNAMKRGQGPPESPPFDRTADGAPGLPPPVPGAFLPPDFQGAGGQPAPPTPPVPGEAPPGAPVGEKTPQPPLGRIPPQDPAAIGGQAIGPEGQPIPSAPAQPPVSDPAVSSQIAGNVQQSGQVDILPDKKAVMRGMAVGMGQALLGETWAQHSERDPSQNAWQGEIGPGKPANIGGALGMPGQANSPEDVAYNRTRFDQSLKQAKGDKFMAAQSSGAFPSGNPIAHGTMSHMKKIAESKDGDGVDSSTMDEGTRRRYKADLTRQAEEFGAYPGMDDPDSPAPPIRPLSFSFNAHTGKWVSPEGQDSILDRFGKKTEARPSKDYMSQFSQQMGMPNAN